jgi:MOSC domain-containing protein YiiM
VAEAAWVVSVNVGQIRTLAGKRPQRSAIDKRPVAGPVKAHPLGLAGDRQADRKHHGGLDQAVYAFASEDLAAWERRLERPLHPGNFGENLTTEGIDLNEARIGERWRVGTVVLEVADVRIPCSTFQQWLGEPRWVRRFSDEGRPGAYLRVIEPGQLEAGDRITVVERRPHDVTVGLVFRAIVHDRALLPRLLAEPRLAAAARRVADRQGAQVG